MAKHEMNRVPLKNLNNFWRTLEMPLINCKVNPFLTCCNRCFKIDNPVDNHLQ